MAALNKRPTADAMSAPSPSIGASAAHSCGEESFTDDCAEELAQSLLTRVGSREQPYTSDELLVRAAQLGEEVRRLTAESFERAMTQRGERAALEEAEAQLGNNHAIGRRRTRSGTVASCSERLATAARSAKLWRERARRPIARGQAPRAMDDGQLKKAFLFSVRRGASRSRLRREKSHLDRILRGGALEELTRERAFVREVRRLALIEGPLLPDRPAAAMVRSGDLDCDLVRPDAAARVFRHTGICVFEGALPEELLDECRTSFARTASQVDQALAARGIGTLTVTDFVTRAYAGNPIAFNEVCQRGTERLDIKLHALPQHCPGVSNGWEPQPMMSDPRLEISARWMPFVRAVLGEGAHECFRGVVDNRPGSTMQVWHADGVHASYADGARTPMSAEAWYAQHGALQSSAAGGTEWWGAELMREDPVQRLTCFLPLTDLRDASCGPTQFFPGSQCHQHANLYRRLHPVDDESQPPFCTPRPGLGSLICFDYRLVHRGSPNVHALGGPTRPILYIVYAREGFNDEQNFPTDRPLF